MNLVDKQRYQEKILTEKCMFISIFACTQLTMSDATIADVGNSMIPRRVQSEGL